MHQTVKLKKDKIILRKTIIVVAIPEGRKTQLSKGAEVIMHQSLGGDFTVTSSHGYMYRIDGTDADALGLSPKPKIADSLEYEELTEDVVKQVLMNVYDPEIPVNIVELGLIYETQLVSKEKNQFDVQVRMTLTAPGCGMGPVLMEDVERKIKELKEVDDVRVTLSFDPPWTPDRMTEAARLQMGML